MAKVWMRSGVDKLYEPGVDGDIEVMFVDQEGGFCFFNARELFANLSVHFEDQPLSLDELVAAKERIGS